MLPVNREADQWQGAGSVRDLTTLLLKGMMKTKQLVLCLAIAGAFLATHSNLAADNKNEEEALQAVVGTFDKAMNAKDAAALSSVFNEDGEFTNVLGMTARGRKAIEEFHRPLFEGDGTKGVPSFKNAVFKVAEIRIRFIRPDVANVDVIWTQTGSTLDGKDRGLRRGLMSWVATKEEGKWGVAVMHNMDLFPVARGAER